MKHSVFIVLFFALSFLGFSQKESVWVKGKVIDSETGKPMFSVRVFNHFVDEGVYTDMNGNFQLLVDTEYLLRFRSIGYDEKGISILVLNDEQPKEVLISMNQHRFSIDDVNIYGELSYNRFIDIISKYDNAELLPWVEKSNFAAYGLKNVPFNSDLYLKSKTERSKIRHKDELEREF